MFYAKNTVSEDPSFALLAFEANPFGPSTREIISSAAISPDCVAPSMESR